MSVATGVPQAGASMTDPAAASWAAAKAAKVSLGRSLAALRGLAGYQQAGAPQLGLAAR